MQKTEPDQPGVVTIDEVARIELRSAKVLEAEKVAGADKLQAAGFLFWGYPLHAPGKKQQLRDAHLDAIAAPMLFVAGTRDPFCDLALLQPVVDRLKPRATLEIITDGDHSFRVPRASAKRQEAVYADIRERSLNWLKQTPGAR